MASMQLESRDLIGVMDSNFQRQMSLREKLELICSGNSQMSEEEKRHFLDKAYEELGRKKNDVELRSNAKGFKLNKTAASMAIFALVLCFFGYSQIQSNISEQREQVSALMRQVTRGQVQQKQFHQITSDKMSKMGFDAGTSLIKTYSMAEDEPKEEPYVTPSLTVNLGPLEKINLKGFDDLKTIAKEQSQMLAQIDNKVKNLTRKVDNATGYRNWDTYEDDVATLSLDSTFLSESEATQIAGLLPADAKLTKAYVASKDGWTHKDWHSIVDGKGPTLTVIKNTKGKVFGGYTDISWSGDGGYQTGKGNSWQFFFNGKEAVKILPKPGENEVMFRYDLLMSYADGIWIYDNCKDNTDSNVDFNNRYYEWPKGSSDIYTAGELVVGVSSSWPKYTCTEIETWFVE